MSDFSVRTDSLIQASDELKLINDRLERITQEARRAVNKATGVISKPKNINVETICSGVMGCSNDIKSLSHVLEKVTNQYGIYEKKIENKDFSPFPVGLAPTIAGISSIQLVSTKTIVSQNMTAILGALASTRKKDLGDTLNGSFDVSSKILKNINKITGNKTLSLGSDLLSYTGALCGTLLSKNQSGKETASNYLTLIKSSGGLWNGMYTLFEKKLAPYESAKLFNKFGTISTGLSIFGNAIGAVQEGMKLYDVLANPESTGYDKASGIIDSIGRTSELAGKAYLATLSKTKSLMFVNNSKAKNQILADMSLKFGNSEKLSKSISAAGKYLTLGKTVASTISGFVKEYGKVSSDGNVSWYDAGSIGVSGSVKGICSLINSGTFGLVNIDSEKFASSLKSDCDEIVNGGSAVGQYISNTDNPAVLRGLASFGVGTYVLGKNIVEGTVNGAKSVGNWVTQAYTFIKNSID